MLQDDDDPSHYIDQSYPRPAWHFLLRGMGDATLPSLKIEMPAVVEYKRRQEMIVAAILRGREYYIEWQRCYIAL